MFRVVGGSELGSLNINVIAKVSAFVPETRLAVLAIVSTRSLISSVRTSLAFARKAKNTFQADLHPQKQAGTDGRPDQQGEELTVC